jgi:hypothetical protein
VPQHIPHHWTLPNGWEWCPIRKVLGVRGDFTPAYQTEDKVLLHTPAQSEPEVRSRKGLPPGTIRVYSGDLLYAPGVVRLAPQSPFEQLAARLIGLYRIDNKEPLFDDQFLLLMMKTAYFRTLLPVDLRIGSPPKPLAKIEQQLKKGLLPRPASLELQRRLVVRVQDLLAHIEAARGNAATDTRTLASLQRNPRLGKASDTRHRLDRIRQLTDENLSILKTAERAILARAIRGEL